MELPQEFKSKMISLLGSEADEFFCALDNPPQKAITINTSRISKEKFEKLADFTFSPIEKIENGYYVENFKFNINPLNHAGIIYSQEPSAMYPVQFLDIQENDIVLDMCASPGGKSIQILEKLNNTGLLVSNEIVYNRAKILFENLTRMGFDNFAITCNNPKDFEEIDIKFDKILIDAPCGGEGMFRRENFDFNSYKLINIETNSKRQLSILESAKNLLKNGGTLVYSTCTYDIRENEEVIANFLKSNPEFEITKLDNFKDIASSGIRLEPFDTDLAFRRYPHKFKGEGQFMIALKKKGFDEESSLSKFQAKGFERINKKEETLINQTFKGIANISDLEFVKRNDTIYALPKINAIDFKNLNLLTIGTVVGSINKNILKINHNFYHSQGERFYKKINLNISELNEYLKGNEIDTQEENGICVICYQDICVGGGKVSNGKIKNYYPKELRI